MGSAHKSMRTLLPNRMTAKPGRPSRRSSLAVQVSVAQVSVAQASVAQASVAQASVAQAAQASVAQVSVAQVSVAQASVAQASVAQALPQRDAAMVRGEVTNVPHYHREIPAAVTSSGPGTTRHTLSLHIMGRASREVEYFWAAGRPGI